MLDEDKCSPLKSECELVGVKLFKITFEIDWKNESRENDKFDFTPEFNLTLTADEKMN